ncbi:MAG: hypothetical protein LKI34_06000 [Bifidobacterium tibiigranuli]|uniref:hypothetical protein n=1 Tax=Bifidobacterium tibiigranuli TaxID=2172043 RepID=UPI0026F282B6|nr:hypothetical protein [Bifidobacterium tibiigranuli]MCI1673747.1 hypothetical protein [Bifidobacterium tibiigranuli]MCI1711996.1 hypothetical protein [Bifidobacterium tibiigranuli]
MINPYRKRMVVWIEYICVVWLVGFLLFAAFAVWKGVKGKSIAWDFLSGMHLFSVSIVFWAVPVWSVIFLLVLYWRRVLLYSVESDLFGQTAPTNSGKYHPGAFLASEHIKEILRLPQWILAAVVMLVAAALSITLGVLKLPFFDTTQEAAARVVATETAAAKSLKAGDCVSIYPSSMFEENLVPTQVASHLVSCSSDNAMLEIISLASADSLKALKSPKYIFAIAALPASVQGFTFGVKPQVGQYFYGFISKTDKNHWASYSEGGKTNTIPQWVKADRKRAASVLKLPASSIEPAYWRVTALKTNSADCTGGYLNFDKDQAVSPPYACVDGSNPGH